MIFRRILSILLSLVLMAGFYVLAVMLEGDQDPAGNAALQETEPLRIQKISLLESKDPQALAAAFGSSLPLPEGLLQGWVKNGSYQGQLTLELGLSGEMANLRGVRPAVAAPSILPRDAIFLPAGRALLGHELLVAGEGEGQVFALITTEAAFLILPKSPGLPGRFILEEVSP